MAAATLRRWTGMDRVLVALLAIAYVPGAPGLGVDTRVLTGTTAGVLTIVFTLAFFAPIVAVALSWRIPLAAAWIALAGGIVAVVLGVLDLVGALAGPPPAGMVVVDVVLIVLGAAVAWRAWGLART